jgi:hypothetical protein
MILIYDRAECMDNLISGTRDSIGTVREAAFKSLSEVILVVGVSPEDNMRSLLSIESCKVSGTLFGCIRAGCLDSKLTTRTNALVALSSYLLVGLIFGLYHV